MYGFEELFSQEFFMYPVTFVFVFAMIFGLLEFVSRKEKHGFLPYKSNILIALVFAFASIAYRPVVVGIWGMLPVAVVIFSVLFLALFLINMFSSGEKKVDTTSAMVTLGLLLIIIGTLWNRIFRSIYIPYLNNNDLLWVIGLIIIIAIFSLANKKS